MYPSIEIHCEGPVKDIFENDVLPIQAPRNGFQLTGAQLLAKEKFPNFFTNFTKISLIKRLNIKN